MLPEPDRLRAEVRAFLRSEVAEGKFEPHCNSWMTQFSPDFSRALAGQGWLGLAWSTQYGGRGGTPRHRLVVTEELLAHGAPVGAHWIADRQMGPNLLAFGSEELKQDLLPRIADGEAFFCIGMSEPDSGSDLASVRTRATKTDGGWLLSGAKVWTTGAHVAQFMMTLARTSTSEGSRHAGLSQLVVPLDSPGVTVSPIISMNGAHHFNEVVLEDVFVPEGHLVGTEGNGWRQVTAELAFERSGPERYLSTYPLLNAWARTLTTDGSTPGAREDLGLLAARLWSLRQMSASIAVSLEAGHTPDVDAAKVKDLGARFETDVIAVVRRHLRSAADPVVERLLAESLADAPTFTLRGGTPEILRGVVARDLGVR
ncbi:acyl-CoA dehydrogenase family protein [Nocardioides sediminis]|uniref:acyl-CoA dehydrogenase family protein n=1 Tax=Nocardioides sediminis TaxID=433648 RepID=UPI001F3EB5E5|nr:acyl-CoA dehydrogenase family protein [Nocardioides sediminis]